MSQSTEALLYIEHKGMVSSDDLRKWRNNSLKGIIGKLEAQSLIDRYKKLGKLYFKLSDNGLNYLDEKLDNLHKAPPANKWLVVLFSIPESKRSLRDRFRRYMQKMGFGNIFKSAWIAISTAGMSEKIAKYAKSLNIQDQVVIIDGSATPNDNRRIVNNVWNLKKITKNYTSFIARNKKIIKKISNAEDPSYEAKKVIFELAQIVAEDPNLPDTLLPQDWPKEKAFAIYKEVRKKIT